jgi:hypothetical protein
MVNRMRLGFIAAVADFALVFAASAGADEKGAAEKPGSGCGYCAAVKHVSDAMRCDGCKAAEKPCDHCADAAKKLMATAACAKCAEMAGKETKPAAACGECTSAMPKDMGHCTFCAEKKVVADHVYCCGKCQAAKKADCPKCQEMRKQVMSVKCASCDKGKS